MGALASPTRILLPVLVQCLPVLHVKGWGLGTWTSGRFLQGKTFASMRKQADLLLQANCSANSQLW